MCALKGGRGRPTDDRLAEGDSACNRGHEQHAPWCSCRQVQIDAVPQTDVPARWEPFLPMLFAGHPEGAGGGGWKWQ